MLLGFRVLGFRVLGFRNLGFHPRKPKALSGPAEICEDSPDFQRIWGEAGVARHSGS